MTAITALYRYPVKGLSPERRDSVVLEQDEGMPLDRLYAITNGLSRFDPHAPRHLGKTNFLMLMRDERLASLETRFEEATQTLSVLRQGKQVARGALNTRLGCQMVEQFFGAFMKGSLRGPPRIISAQGQPFSFTDCPRKLLHVVNLASVRELERAAGRPIDPLRFRANIYVDGVEPWVEFQWVGKTLTIGRGVDDVPTGQAVRLAVIDRTDRCDTINVDPATGARDMGLTAVLSRSWGHTDFGIYATVAARGAIATGPAIFAVA